jgi:hypothetical protein
MTGERERGQQRGEFPLDFPPLIYPQASVGPESLADDVTSHAAYPRGHHRARDLAITAPGGAPARG